MKDGLMGMTKLGLCALLAVVVLMVMPPKAEATNFVVRRGVVFRPVRNAAIRNQLAAQQLAAIRAQQFRNAQLNALRAQQFRNQQLRALQFRGNQQLRLYNNSTLGLGAGGCAGFFGH